MSTAALTLLVLIAGGPSGAASAAGPSGEGSRETSGPVAASMARAVREALGPEAHVIVREVPRIPSDDEAIVLGRDVQATAVIELLWKDAEHRRATLHFHAEPAASRWTDREVGFDASDADAERGRMIGFALASMLPERATSAPAPPPASVPAAATPPAGPRHEPGDPDARDLRREPEQPSPPGEALRWVGALEGAAAAGLGGDATGIGGALAVRWDFAPAFSVRLGGTLRSGQVTAADASSTILEGALGLVWRALPETTTRPFGLAMRADVLGLQYRLERASSHATLWLPGADLALEGSWMLARPLALFAALGGEVAFGATDVFLFSQRVTTISPVRGLGEAGVRVHF